MGWEAGKKDPSQCRLLLRIPGSKFEEVVEEGGEGGTGVPGSVLRPRKLRRER